MKKSTLYFLRVLLTLLSFKNTRLFSSEVKAASSLRIMDGRDANINEFPFVVQLLIRQTNQLDYSPFCSGSALSPSWTLTAWHCIDKPSKYVIDIRYGYPHGRPSKEDGMSAVLNHVKPSGVTWFERSIIFADIALLQTEPILISKYAKISAVDFTTLYGHEVVLVGFGRTREGNSIGTPHDLNKTLQVIDKTMLKECDKTASINNYPSLCAVAACHSTSRICRGDSGAPMLHSTGVVGVVARRISDCVFDDRLRSKDILTGVPISPFIDWISDVTSSATSHNKTV